MQRISSWILTEKLKNMLDSFATTCYRYILNISKLEKISNEKILKMINKIDLHKIIQSRQIKFINNLQKLNNENISKMYSLYTPKHGKR